MATKKKAKRPRKSKAKRKSVSTSARIVALEKQVKALTDAIKVIGGAACRTVVIKGNLQIINGMGRTDRTNGCGNLIIGYNELPPASSGWPSTRTGSHNLIIGRYHSHASYAGLLSGEMNLVSAAAPSSAVVGGSEGSANADRVVVMGGQEGKGNAARSVVIGGFDNGASAGANLSVCIGGTNNRADASQSTLLGGSGLTTTTPGERIP
jgi:hypothetical protein